MRELQVRSRQRARALNAKFLAGLTRALLEQEFALANYELGISFVSARRMAEINQHYLRHEGSTDVITFDYRDGYDSESDVRSDLAGEIYISVSDAVRQAREFGTRWEDEIVRYIVHGILHLRGFDDITAPQRKAMKREENRLLARLKKSFNLRSVAR